MPAIAPAPPKAPRRSRTHELAWRLILDEPRRGAANMALDHALAACLRPGEGVVRLYGWSRPTVSFGKNEPAARVPPKPATGAVEPAYVRRPTGGRAVLHDQEVTYAVVAPLDAFGGLREAYLRINRALAEAMRALGVAVELAGSGPGSSAFHGRTRTPAPDAGPCFQSPSPGEVVSGGRKLVGSAQARLEGVLLQHGSILVGGDQRLPGAGERDGAVTLRELLGPVDWNEVTRATAVALRAGLGGEWTEAGYGSSELEAASRLEAARYAQDTWTWRRRQEWT